MIELKTVLHIAELSKLKFPSDEVQKFQEELGKIISYMDKLKTLEIKKVGDRHACSLLFTEYLPRKALKLREDKPVPYKEQTAILAGAPEVLNNYFVVPKIIEKQ